MVRWDTAVRNIGALFGEGIEPYAPTPSVDVYDHPHRRLRHYRRATPGRGNPILLVPPLAVTISCYDLRPGQSLVEFLLALGREVYVIDYGEIGYADRDLGFEEWVDDIVPDAIRRVSAEHAYAPVDVIGWSFGGTISLLTTAADPALPVASVTAVGSPFDQRRNGPMSLARSLGRLAPTRIVTEPVRLLGGIPKQAVRMGFRAQSLDRELTKPWYIARHAGDAESLARMQAVDRFMDQMPGYPGRFYRQVYRQLIIRNEMWTGTVHLNPDHAIDLTTITVPVLLVGGTRDTLASAASVAAGTEVLTGAQTTFAEVEGSHLGIIAGPGARTGTWAAIADFLGDTPVSNEISDLPSRTLAAR
ncbi:alpha/beta fold hydrolase [Nocardia asteroides]|uniref:alpha/beta fold hydrolase n=1 Tax=Nocardia asteroides TaxID=1824 RepID=UPI001E5B0906|nr:alpha/beta fold hydrolase [Nocardia asteroides]UGT55294.1 alpha/beta fold hydrolase [Nocardia asteroides]